MEKPTGAVKTNHQTEFFTNVILARVNNNWRKVNKLFKSVLNRSYASLYIFAFWQRKKQLIRSFSVTNNFDAA